MASFAFQVANEECQIRNKELNLALANARIENAHQTTLIQKLENDVGKIQMKGILFAATGGESPKVHPEWSPNPDSTYYNYVQEPVDRAGLATLSLRGRSRTVSTALVKR